MKTFKTRLFGMILYPENQDHKIALEYIEYNFDFVYILHDKDDKKEHWHVLVRFDNPRHNTAFAKEIGVEINLIQKIRNADGAMRYLIHSDDINKTQYPFNELIGTDEMLNYVKTAIEKDRRTDEESSIIILLQFIDDFDGFLTTRTFINYVLQMKMWSIYRRSASILDTIIREHNSKHYIDNKD